MRIRSITVDGIRYGIGEEYIIDGTEHTITMIERVFEVNERRTITRGREVEHIETASYVYKVISGGEVILVIRFGCNIKEEY